jgi:hypothetical protein
MPRSVSSATLSLRGKALGALAMTLLVLAPPLIGLSCGAAFFSRKAGPPEVNAFAHVLRPGATSWEKIPYPGRGPVATWLLPDGRVAVRDLTLFPSEKKAFVHVWSPSSGQWAYEEQLVPEDLYDLPVPQGARAVRLDLNHLLAWGPAAGGACPMQLLPESTSLPPLAECPPQLDAARLSDGELVAYDAKARQGWRLPRGGKAWEPVELPQFAYQLRAGAQRDLLALAPVLGTSDVVMALRVGDGPWRTVPVPSAVRGDGLDRFTLAGDGSVLCVASRDVHSSPIGLRNVVFGVAALVLTAGTLATSLAARMAGVRWRWLALALAVGLVLTVGLLFVAALALSSLAWR